MSRESLEQDQQVEGAEPPQRILDRLGIERRDDTWRTHKIIDERWRLNTQVGYGAFGKVYDAVDTATGRQVAVKVFNERFKNSGYLQELGLLFGESHPHIVTVYSFGYNSGNKYLVYEYVPGGSLRDYMVRYPKVDALLATDVVLQIAEGLCFAHQRNVVHRDLKPENILLTELDWPFQIKICDFGLAQRCREKETMVSSFGSAAYMAPEQFRENYDHRVDIYALGVIYYEMLFGRRPIGGDEASVLYAHQRLEIVLPEHGPEGLKAFLRKTLAKNPDDRYATVGELCESLKRLRAELSEPRTGPLIVPRPPRIQPELKQRWKTVLPFSGKRFCVTDCGKLVFVGKGRILTIDGQGDCQQLFRIQGEPQLLEGGCTDDAFGWVVEDHLHVWKGERQVARIELDPSVLEGPLQAQFCPTKERVLVSTPTRLYLYAIDGRLVWRADIATYGLLPPVCFSQCGEYVWVAVEAPRTQLLCIDVSGTCRSRSAANHHEVELLGHRDGRVLVGEKGGYKLSLVNPDGFVEAEAELHEPLYEMTRLGQHTIVINSVSHFELVDVEREIRSAGFFASAHPQELSLVIPGGFFQVCPMGDRTRIRFLELAR
jgi:hypothetical protein